MANQHVYILLVNLALNNTQRNTLAAAIFALGREENGPCHRRMIRRIRLDNQAMFFRAVFNEDHLTLPSLVNFVANALGVAANTITTNVSTTPLADRNTQIVTLGRGGTDYIEFWLLGKSNSTWPTVQQSGDAARAYHAAHRAEWETAL